MTDTATHTPGPWWRDEDGFIAAGSGDSYVTIASFDCSLDLDIDEREANKALAIAAPAMRSALAEALAYEADAFDADDDEEHPVNGGDLVEWFSGWRETAKAALSGAPPAPSDAPADPVKAEMLAALKAVKAARDLPHYGDESAALDHFHEAMPAVEAAIARAEGEA